MYREPYTSSVSWLHSAIEALNAAGYDGAQMMRANGIDTSYLISDDGRAPVAVINKAWKVVANAVDDPSVGVCTALKHFNPADWQSLGLAVLCSSTLRQAFTRLVKYFGMLSDAANTRVEESGDRLSFIAVTRLEPEIIGHEALEYGLAALLVLMREIYPRELNPVEIRLLRPQHLASDEFSRLFQCPIIFGSDYEVISFDLAIVDEQLPSSNPLLAKYQDSFSEHYIEKFGNNSTSFKVKNEILRLLPGGEPTLAKVAETLCTSKRNLQRQLSSEQVTYRELVTDIRRQLAHIYLVEDQHSFTETAYLLGFGDQSNFARAFKQWYQLSPSEYLKSVANSAS